jgi:hypothetical protein
VLLLVHFCLLEEGLSAVLVATVGPVVAVLYVVAKDVCLEPLLDVGLMDGAEMVGDWLHEVPQEEHVLVPLLVDDGFQILEVAAHFFADAFLGLVPSPEVLTAALAKERGL